MMINYVKKCSLPHTLTMNRFLAIPARFERATYCLEGSCSIQLSYGTLFVIIYRKASKRQVVFINDWRNS